MRRLITPALLCLPLALTVSCTGNGDDDTGDDTPTPRDGGIVERDAGPPRDAGPRDGGLLPCIFDQGGYDNRGCPSGMVCNLEMDPPACVAGKACSTDSDCDACSDLNPANREECGHGFSLTAWCDPNHGNVCTRSRAPCEPCETDAECGRRHPVLANGAPNVCVEFVPGGDKFCTRSAPNCPDGFTVDTETNLCTRAAGCAPLPTVCPANPVMQSCGNGQICEGETCPDTGGARCSTNNEPGVLGTCIGFCTQDSDCPEATPICNKGNGICISGCTPGSCPDTQVCHLDGFCAPRCEADTDCTGNPDYGEQTYCNLPGRPQPTLFKTYRDPNSCAPLGCERSQEDCWGGTKERVCDPTQAPPRCVDGCYRDEDDENPELSDCRSGRICRSGPQGSYTREQCRALPDKTNEAEIGVCCDPGCRDRNLQCVGFGKFCCAEPDSPYEDDSTCLTLTSTDTVVAQPGECFEHPAPAPFCTQCNVEGFEECNSGWTAGFNTDPNFNGGMPFQEQEFCTTIATNMGMPPSIAICTVTCDPKKEDTGCPSRWSCTALRPGCLSNADCNEGDDMGGLECIGEDTSTNPPTEGVCKCGEDLVQTVACPNTYPRVGMGMIEIERPRCEPFSDDMVCVGTYTCQPPGTDLDGTGYPAACNFMPQ